MDKYKIYLVNGKPAFEWNNYHPQLSLVYCNCPLLIAHFHKLALTLTHYLVMIHAKIEE